MQTVKSVSVRPMKATDMAAAMAILQEWNMAPVADDSVANPERSELVVDLSFVAELEGEMVGVCSMILHSPTLAETASLAVSPAARGTGAGYLLQVARLREMRRRGIETVHTETDRPDTIDWYVRKFGYRVVGSNPKKHSFSLADVDQWTVLQLDLRQWQDPD